MRVLGLDLGSKTLGIAISDELGLIANPLKTIKYDNIDVLVADVIELIQEKKVKAVALGFPKNMNNTLGEAAARSEKFKKMLSQKIDIPIILIDERLSTKEAENVLINGDMSRKKRKKVIDSLAATIILETYLNRKEK